MEAIGKKFFQKFSTFYGSNRSTIYALATGGTRSALAVVRVSGPNSRDVLNTLGKFGANRFPEARKATLRKLYDPLSCNLIDHGIVLWFPGPSSYTGEDCCEFHIHGGSAVVSGLLQSIQNVPGCRMAEPGEFTKRAFLSGKMDLTEVDGLADLIAAETEMQRIQALRQMSGSLSRIYEQWREKIAKCLAKAEAYIDFGEDENIESEVMEEVEKDVESLIQHIQNHLKDERRGQRLRNGIRIAILGKPNVGKSSLLNLLCRREAAIVSNIPGTTRDVIEGCVNIKGFPVIFADTAGIRSTTTDHIEAEGIRRSLAEAKTADLIILLIDAFQLISAAPSFSSKNEFLQSELAGFIATAPKDTTDWEDVENRTVVVLNKLDLVEPKHLTAVQTNFDSVISCKTTEGVDNFYQLLSKSISDLCGDPKKDSPCVTQERYRSELESCVQSLLQFQEHTSYDLALRTNHLKNAINSIGSITGHFGTEDILDIIFRDFCIGK